MIKYILLIPARVLITVALVPGFWIIGEVLYDDGETARDLFEDIWT